MTRSILSIGAMLMISFDSSGQIEGVVMNKKKIAIVDVVIIATEITRRTIDTVRSNQKGAYAFSSLRPGKYNVEAKMEGFLPCVYNNIEITTAPEGTDEHDDTYYAVRLDITLTPAKPIK